MLFTDYFTLLTSQTTGILCYLTFKILISMLPSPDTPNLITGVSDKPLGVRIYEDPIHDDGIRIFDCTQYFERNVHATLNSNGRRIYAPFPGASEWQNVFGYNFFPSDVERVYRDGKLIWIPRECRKKGDKKYVDLLERGIIKIELLDYPDLVRFIQKNREKLLRLGFNFDK